jgi:hypothetical protein
MFLPESPHISGRPCSVTPQRALIFLARNVVLKLLRVCKNKYFVLTLIFLASKWWLRK